MKQLTLILLLTFSTLLVGQTTAIPDANFEQALINLGYDSGPINGSVLTSNINGVISLEVSAQNISDLTGIQDFTSLTILKCGYNQLSGIDVTQNAQLIELWCYSNAITSIDVTQNSVLDRLDIFSNQLTSLDVTQNLLLDYLRVDSNQLTNINVTQNPLLYAFICSDNLISSLNLSQNSVLFSLYCGDNQLTELDVSLNPGLAYIVCSRNQLNCLNVKNGNNINFGQFYAESNSNLTCIEVDSTTWSITNWTVAGGNIDAIASFSSNCNNSCSGVGINELSSSSITTHPNPTTGQLTISLAKANTGVLSIRNYLGQLIKQAQFNNTKELNISLDGPSGLYFLQLEIDGKVITKKVVKE